MEGIKMENEDINVCACCGEEFKLMWSLHQLTRMWNRKRYAKKV